MRTLDKIINDDAFVLVMKKSEFKIIMEELNDRVERSHIDLDNDDFWDVWHDLVGIEEALDNE